MSAFGLGDAALTAGTQAAAYTAALAAALAVLARRVIAMASQRLPWLLMGTAASVLGACQLALVWSQPTPGGVLALDALRHHPEAFLAGLAAYPVMYGGLLALRRHRVRGVVASAWLDGAGASLLLASASCALLAPLLADRLSLSTPAAVALVMRPLLDLLLVAFAASVCGLTAWRSERRLIPLVGTFVVLAMADTTGVLRVTGALAPWSQGGAGVLLATGVDLARLAALLLLGAAAAPTGTRTEVRAIGWSAVIGPAAVTGGALVLLVVDLIQPVGGPAVALAIATLAAVSVRRLLLFGEVLQLGNSRRLALSDDLTGLANRRALHMALATALGPTAVVDTPPRSERGLQYWRLALSARAEAGGEQALVALLLLDLNGFKQVNDRYGHDAGDALLRSTANYLRAALPAGALLVRLGGDEFAVLLTGEQAGRAVTVASIAAAAVNRTTVVSTGGATGGSARVGVATSASVGVTVHEVTSTGSSSNSSDSSGTLGWSASLIAPRLASRFAGMTAPAAPGTTPRVGSELLRRADVAMYRAKAAGGGVRVFDAADDDAAREKAMLLEELRALLAPGLGGLAAPAGDSGPGVGWGPAAPAKSARPAGGQLVVHYQPQVDVRTGAAAGVEALVRWRHPRLGLLGPDAFVGLAEEHALMTQLTASVLSTAARDAVRWHRAGHGVRMAVNLSASCLSSAALLPLLEEVLAATGVEPSLLVLEVTETMMMSNPQQALVTAQGIRARGVQLSIDDYGTGHSSLAYLADLPATELKLDRSFTARLTTDPAIAAIVASTVDLAHRLGLRLVAEGVEDAATLAALAALGCDEAQGYFHARPAPAPQMDRWLLERVTAPW